MSDAVSGPPVAPATCAANHGCKRARSTPGGVSVTAGRLQSRCQPGAGRRAVEFGWSASGDAGLARRNGLAVATRVPGDPTDGHVDTETRGGALLFGLGAPEPVLAVRTGPV